MYYTEIHQHKKTVLNYCRVYDAEITNSYFILFYFIFNWLVVLVLFSYHYALPTKRNVELLLFALTWIPFIVWLVLSDTS